MSFVAVETPYLACHRYAQTRMALIYKPCEPDDVHQLIPSQDMGQMGLGTSGAQGAFGLDMLFAILEAAVGCCPRECQPAVGWKSGVCNSGQNCGKQAILAGYLFTMLHRNAWLSDSVLQPGIKAMLAPVEIAVGRADTSARGV